MRDGTECAGREHDLVVVDERVLIHTTVDVASRDVIADLALVRGGRMTAV